MKTYTVDLVDLIKHFWTKKWQLLKIVGVFIILGFIIAFGSSEEYSASCKFLVKNKSNSKVPTGGLSNLAGLAGINLNLDQNEFLSPTQYNDIIKSHTFSYELLNKPLKFNTVKDSVSAYTYFREVDSPSLVDFVRKYTIGLPGQIIKLFKSSETGASPISEEIRFRINRIDAELLDSFKQRVSIEVDYETGIIKLTSMMPEPQAASDLTIFTFKKLQKLISIENQRKAKEELDNAQVQMIKSKDEFEYQQRALVQFQEGHANLVSFSEQAEKTIIQSEYQIAFELYKAASLNYEQAKLKLVESRPLFLIVNPVQYPVDNSEPKRLIILVLFTLFGLFVSISFQTLKFVYFPKKDE